LGVATPGSGGRSPILYGQCLIVQDRRDCSLTSLLIIIIIIIIITIITTTTTTTATTTIIGLLYYQSKLRNAVFTGRNGESIKAMHHFQLHKYKNLTPLMRNGQNNSCLR